MFQRGLGADVLRFDISVVVSGCGRVESAGDSSFEKITSLRIYNSMQLSLSGVSLSSPRLWSGDARGGD